MKTIVDQYERAKRAWDILVEYAGNGQYTTYGELGERMGVHCRTCRYFLGKIQQYCKNNNLPPLQSLVINKSTRKPGEGYVATATDNMQSIHQRVFGFDWDSISNPF